jgi:hypothetical protein
MKDPAFDWSAGGLWDCGALSFFLMQLHFPPVHSFLELHCFSRDMKHAPDLCSRSPDGRGSESVEGRNVDSGGARSVVMQKNAGKRLMKDFGSSIGWNGKTRIDKVNEIIYYEANAEHFGLCQFGNLRNGIDIMSAFQIGHRK